MPKRRYVETVSSSSSSDTEHDLDLNQLKDPEGDLDIDSPLTTNTLSPSPSVSTHKIVRSSTPDENMAAATVTIIHCHLPSCPSPQFTNHEAYEAHYLQYHTNRCLECGKNFPTERVLGCHITENHDAFAMGRKERGEKIYECFDPSCDRFCRTGANRKLHLIAKHFYPEDFNFWIVNDGIDRKNSLLVNSANRRSKTRIRGVSDASAANSTPLSPRRGKKDVATDVEGMDVDMAEKEEKKPKKQVQKRSLSASEVMKREETQNDEDDVMSDLTTKMSKSAISMVPTSVRFGRRGIGFPKK